ncbi:hypothetical protein [Microbacterium sp. P05]|uniref:hypothetical protein n=1 Tax=Microbacterium sp. P05 TaxID=3366948 RepID=UPI0037461C93
MSQTTTPGKKRLAIALAAVLMLGGAGAAFAYWTSTGTGEGEATTGESVAFTITSEPAVGIIVPGGVGQTVDFTVANPGTGSQYLTAVTVELAEADGTPWAPPAGCEFEDYTAAITTAPPAGDIAAGGSVQGTATVTLANTAVNQNACQEAVVPLYFEAS